MRTEGHLCPAYFFGEFVRGHEGDVQGAAHLQWTLRLESDTAHGVNRVVLCQSLVFGRASGLLAGCLSAGRRQE